MVTLEARRSSAISAGLLIMRHPEVTGVALVTVAAGTAFAMLSAKTNGVVSSMPILPVRRPASFRPKAARAYGLSSSCQERVSFWREPDRERSWEWNQSSALRIKQMCGRSRWFCDESAGGAQTFRQLSVKEKRRLTAVSAESNPWSNGGRRYIRIVRHDVRPAAPVARRLNDGCLRSR